MASAPSSKKLKKSDSTARPEFEIRDFDVETQRCLEEIDKCQDEIELLNEQSSQEVFKIEQKFNILRKPIYYKREEIINKVPNFWHVAFTNHPELGTLLAESEEDCFHYLTKLEVEEFEDVKSGFRISFYFDENPYFENDMLKKEIQLRPTEIPKSISIPIRWKEGMNLSTKNDVSSLKSERKRRLDHRSFFIWYNDHGDPTADDIAEIIKDDLWNNPLQYFLLPDIYVDSEEDEDCEDAKNGDEESEEEDNIHAATVDPNIIDLDTTVEETTTE